MNCSRQGAKVQTAREHIEKRGLRSWSAVSYNCNGKNGTWRGAYPTFPAPETPISAVIVPGSMEPAFNMASELTSRQIFSMTGICAYHSGG
jgi:hypothetical protein